ncbi:ergosterol biosynthetic protein 28 homolog [Saccostrea echinata]|uniref:ergosterol biosynthetic protein 28 homolog n=1 Tax=Saccostrea echinata TaxID=191078 RepID=UPI002A82753A|nr:ergosterol biosynthetic protein 28 homolog [Saccostrea echinata]
MNKKVKKLNFTYFARVWIIVVSIVNFGDSLQYFKDNSLLSRLIYTQTPHYANPVFGRIYGIFNFLLAALRFSCAVDIHNKSLYNLTLLSFALTFGNTFTEVVVFRTASVNFAILSNLALSGISVISLLFGFKFVCEEAATDLESDTFLRTKRS